MFIGIVVMFIACHSIKFVLLVTERHLTQSEIEHMMNAYVQDESLPWTLCSLFEVVNSSANILIYCWKDGQFRKVALEVIGLAHFFKETKDVENTE